MRLDLVRKVITTYMDGGLNLYLDQVFSSMDFDTIFMVTENTFEKTLIIEPSIS